MATSQTLSDNTQKNTLDNAMDALFSMLDKGLDDLEQGHMLTSEEVLSELDALDQKGA